MVILHSRHLSRRAPALARLATIAFTLTVARSAGAQSTAVMSGYGPNEVDVRATLGASAGAPGYPRDLARVNMEGRVTVAFIVDTTGLVDGASMRFTASTHGLFEASVHLFLDSARFTPAIRGGRAVRQTMEMPFAFSLPNRIAEIDFPPSGTIRVMQNAALTPGTGRPGDSSVVQISAIMSGFRSQAPLYVVNGVAMDSTATSSSFGGLDIASVEVIRGGAAASLYGPRAAGGVIAITTKPPARGGRGPGGYGAAGPPGAARGGGGADSSTRRLDASQMPVPNFSNGALSITGKVAGVTITSSSGRPGDATGSHLALASYRTQGYLFVVDGVTMLDTANFDRVVDRLRLDTVEVLRPGAAVQLYGAAAINGAIAIVTKKGP